MSAAQPARISVIAAAALYAVFSSPTPDAPGLIEYLILGLLMLAALWFRAPRDIWAAPFALLLVYGVCVATAIGVVAGHGAGDITRDLVAFGALAVPFVYARQFDDHGRLLLGLLLGIGFVFSARYLVGAADHITQLGLGPLDHHLLYLANSPLVAFAACWLLLHGCFVERRPAMAVLCIALALLPLAAMVGMMQRATLALLALAWGVFFLRCCVRTPGRAGLVALGAIVVCACVWPLPFYIVESLREKTLSVGWNARESELRAVMDAVAQNPLTAIFGSGWGSLMKSPAVGDEWVRFSHSLASALLWKTGFIGLILGGVALGALIVCAHRRLRGDMVMATALILPLLPALFLYGSYKSLCFGLLLLGLVCAWTALDQNVSKSAAKNA